MNQEQYSILLIDDDEVDRMIIKRALKKAQFSVTFTEVSSGIEAIDTLQAKKKSLFNLLDSPSFPKRSIIDIPVDIFDIILLDYRLPDTDGLELIKKIQELHLSLPIIILTGQGDEEIAVEIMKAGAADYFSKAKIEPDSLAKAINNAIRINKAEQAVELANKQLRASNELLVQKNQELERQQEKIKLQNIKLQESYNLKSEFLATMSHELRTPMNAIMGFSQLLLRQYPDPLSEQQQNLVERIFHNSKNLLNMINEMLDFSKIEAAKLEIKPEKLDLSYLILLTTEELRSLAVQKQLNLITKIELQDRFLFQDSSFIKRAIINLLSNAIKFTQSGEIVIKAWEINSNTIGISVKDTGMGIAEEDRDKIFQAFRQIDQSYTRQHSGTGLGLAITQSLVLMMKGNISLQSEVGRGSIFTIEIPRKYDSQNYN